MGPGHPVRWKREKKTQRPHSSNKPWLLVHIWPRRLLWWQYRCSCLTPPSLHSITLYHSARDTLHPFLRVLIVKLNLHCFDQSQSFNCHIVITLAWLVGCVYTTAKNHSACAGLISANMSVHFAGFYISFDHWSIWLGYFFSSNWLCHVGNERFPEAELRSVHVCWWRRK